MTFDTKTMENIQSEQAIEVINADNRPIAVMPKRLVHRQLLMHRSVQVMVFNPERKIYLQRRNRHKQLFPGRWDISARTHPLAGESTYDAALRTLSYELNLDVEHPVLIRELPAGPPTGFERVYLYAVYKNTLPIRPNGDEVDEGYYYSQEELTCLVKEFRELLTPNLVVLWESGLLSPS